MLLPGVQINPADLGVLLGKKKMPHVQQCSRWNPQFSKYTYIVACNSNPFCLAYYPRSSQEGMIPFLEYLISVIKLPY